MVNCLAALQLPCGGCRAVVFYTKASAGLRLELTGRTPRRKFDGLLSEVPLFDSVSSQPHNASLLLLARANSMSFLLAPFSWSRIFSIRLAASLFPSRPAHSCRQP